LAALPLPSIQRKFPCERSRIAHRISPRALHRVHIPPAPSSFPGLARTLGANADRSRRLGERSSRLDRRLVGKRGANRRELFSRRGSVDGPPAPNHRDRFIWPPHSGESESSRREVRAPTKS